MPHTNIQRQFNPNHPKYFCCCGCHVMSGAKIFGYINSSSMGLWALTILNNGVHWSYTTSVILYCLIGLTCIVALRIGVSHERAGYLIPFMVYTVLSIMGAIMVFFLPAVDVKAFESFLNWTGNKNGGYFKLSLGVFFWVVFGIGCLHMWSFYIVKKAYGYIQHKRSSAMYQSTNVHYMQQELVAVPKESSPPPSYEWQQQV